MQRNRLILNGYFLYPVLSAGRGLSPGWRQRKIWSGEGNKIRGRCWLYCGGIFLFFNSLYINQHFNLMMDVQFSGNPIKVKIPSPGA